MTIYEDWMLRQTPHYPFLTKLFELYQMADQESKITMERAWPEYFILERKALA